MVVGVKQCSRCKQHLSVSYFYLANKSTERLQGYCKDCAKIAGRENYSTNKQAAKNRQLKKSYGITLADYERLFEIQNGRCAICGSTKGNKRTGYLFVDHNHRTGEIRSLLCHLCNTGLGSFRDNPDLLRTALRYLENDG